MADQPLVHVILPVHNRKAITLAFVECLKRQSDQNFRLILVDDGSCDGTADAVIQQLPLSTVLRGDGSLWWAGALQQAIEWLRQSGASLSDVVLFINDDTIIPEDFIEVGKRLVLNSSRTGGDFLGS